MGIGLAITLAACQGGEAPVTTPPSSQSPASSPTPTPAYDGNLRALMIPMPDGAQAVAGYGASGELGARRAADVIAPFTGSDEVQERLEQLGLVRGALKQWIKSGADGSVLLLQFLDEPSAAEYVAYAQQRRGGSGEELAGIEGGVWFPNNTGAQAVFHRDGIAVEMAMSSDANFNADEFLAMVTQQYDRLPA